MAKNEWLKAFKNADNEAIKRLLEENEAVLSLEAASMNGGHYSGLVLKALNLENTEWDACIFDNVEFIDCNLTGALFNASTMFAVKFESCQLSDASFDGCVMQRSSLANISDSEGLELTDCQLKECTLENIDFADARLHALSFTSGRIARVSGEAELSGIVLRGVEVEAFDTSEMQVLRCTASGMSEVPEGFILYDGRRKRV
ncbi:MAG: pentapeptide repeat-containing protein [Bradymonadales bacterium]|jgi:uncharacterized protein YjbI with pentapeptide repeats